MEMNYPGGKTQHFRHLLFFAFHRNQKAAEAAREICSVYGEGVLGVSTAHKWFAKFKNGDFNLEDTPRSGRPVELDEEHLKELLKEDNRQTSRQLAEKMNCDQKTILNHLHSMGFAENLGAWIPNELNEQLEENFIKIEPVDEEATNIFNMLTEFSVPYEDFVASSSAPKPPSPKKENSKSKVPKVAAAKSSNPSFENMIKIAIQEIADRKGASKQAIAKYISDNFNFNGTAAQQAAQLRSALKRAVASGAIKQASGTGANGRFRVVEKKKSTAKKKSS